MFRELLKGTNSSHSYKNVPDNSNPQDRKSKYLTHYRPDQRFQFMMFIAITLVVVILTGIFGLMRPVSVEFPLLNPNLRQETHIFRQDTRYTDDTSEGDVEWDKLVPNDGLGFVRVEDEHKYGLHGGYQYKNKSEHYTAFTVAMYHQLHCVMTLRQAFLSLYQGREVYSDKAHETNLNETEKMHMRYQHANHCFDYLRQAIMCYADTTLEGVDELGLTHQCKRWDEFERWYHKYKAPVINPTD
ncbi:hypothetical protein J3E71DRAFT_245706 [Bipolaris maydis]|nr:hypothetical protein J3E71DRAFT_245706 [Bipolaris maydis]